MGLRLYEIAAEYNAFMYAVDNGEIEDMQAISDTLDGIQQEFDAKVENIALLYKSLAAEAEAIDNEAKALAARARYKKNVCDRLKSYVASNLQAIGQSKFETAKCKLSFRKSEALEIDDPEALRTSLCSSGGQDMFTTETTYKFDKAAIKSAIKDGAEYVGCHVATNNNLQIK